MNLTPKFKLCEIVVLFCLALPITISGYDPGFPDFPGPYCAKIKKCCDNRQDSCSVRISDTLCYCDAFCERDRNPDCCPDYKPHCSPGSILSCFHNGQYLQYPQKVQENCNTCKCGLNGKMECTDNTCITDEALVHNVNLISGSLGWEARNYSEFWGRKLKEGLTLRLGTLEPSHKVKSMTRLTNRHTRLVRNFNALDHWRLSNEIVDQGWCGTSWVVSTTSVASDRFAVQSMNREIVQLAPQHILSCARRSRGCQGGHLDVAWRFLNKNGVVDKDCYPYNHSIHTQNGRCKIRHTKNLEKAGCKTPPTYAGRTEFYRMGPAYSLNNETDIMSEIMESGPVQATMRVYRDFFSYSRGVYRHSAASRSEDFGFHSVRLVGWGEEPGYNPIKYWIAANSWGDWWGENGFFRIRRGSNECLIEDYVLASWPHVYDDIKNHKSRP